VEVNRKSELKTYNLYSCFIESLITPKSRVYLEKPDYNSCFPAFKFTEKLVPLAFDRASRYAFRNFLIKNSVNNDRRNGSQHHNRKLRAIIR
jgi:hypothetical protein